MMYHFMLQKDELTASQLLLFTFNLEVILDS